MARNTEEKQSRRSEHEGESERMNLYLLGDKYARNFSFCAPCAYGTNDMHRRKKEGGLTDLACAFLPCCSVRSLAFFLICLLQRFCTNKVLVIFELFSLWLPEIFITQHWVSFCFLLDTLLKFWFTRFFLVSTINSCFHCLFCSSVLSFFVLRKLSTCSTCIDILNFLYSTNE